MSDAERRAHAELARVRNVEAKPVDLRDFQKLRPEVDQVDRGARYMAVVLLAVFSFGVAIGAGSVLVAQSWTEPAAAEEVER